MKETCHVIRIYVKEFRRRWYSYLLLFFLPEYILTRMLMPGLHSLASYLLRSAGIPFITHSTVIELIKKPGQLAGLLVLTGILLLAALYQYVVLMIGMRQVREDRDSMGSILTESWQCMKVRGFHAAPGLVVYFLLIMPFGSFIYSSSAFSKIGIPKFILEYLVSKIWAIPLLVLAYGLAFFAAVQRIYILPLIILNGETTKEAIRESKERTKGTIRRIILRVLLITILVGVIYTGLSFFSYRLQVLLDRLPYHIPAVTAAVLLSLLKFAGVYLNGFYNMLMFMAMLPDEDIDVFHMRQDSPANKALYAQLQRHKYLAASAVLGIWLLTFGYHLNLLLFSADFHVVTISHRGVDGVNGVQNTIPAMAATIASGHPDYIEMDVRETKDHRFVVMHDESLRQLCGVEGSAADYTLDEMKQMTASENGYSAPVASFDEYLEYADAHQQKLLIELKTTKNDSKDILDLFLEQYGDDIVAMGHQVHSMDYALIEELKQKRPDITAEVILAYNLIFPQSDADGYTMELTSLNEAFINRANMFHKKVYAWTVNSKEDMDAVLLLGATGIITDEVSLLNQEEERYVQSPDYSDRLRFFMINTVEN